MKYYSLTNQQFVLIEPIFAEEWNPRGRKPRISDRHALKGILYILREGCRWRALPDFFGPWMTVFMRNKRWIERGVLWKVLMRLQKAHVLEVKVHVLVDGFGRLLAVYLSGGQASDHKYAPALAIEAARHRVDMVVVDKGYDSRALGESLRAYKIEPTIPIRGKA